MVADAADRHLVRIQAPLRLLQRLEAVSDLQRHVRQSHRLGGRVWRVLSNGHDGQVVVVRARREEDHPAGEARHLLESQNLGVEPGRAVQIPRLQHDVADALYLHSAPRWARLMNRSLPMMTWS